jgi:hypothetical protein
MSSHNTPPTNDLEEGEVLDQPVQDQPVQDFSVQETWSKDLQGHQEKKIRLKKKKKEKQKEKKIRLKKEREKGIVDGDSKFKNESFVPLKDKDSDLMREVISLRMELKGAYQMMRIVQSGLNETITRERNKNIEVEVVNDELMTENDELMTENDELREELNKSYLAYTDSLERRVNEHHRLLDSQEQWIGRTLKFQYLFQQMEKIGLQQSEDIFDAFQDIEVPEVSINIKDKFVPTAQTDNIDWSDEEEVDDDEWVEPDIIGEEQSLFDNWVAMLLPMHTNEDFRPDDEDMSEVLCSMFNED